jgi:hypothetical protein
MELPSESTNAQISHFIPKIADRMQVGKRLVSVGPTRVSERMCKQVSVSLPY